MKLISLLPTLFLASTVYADYVGHPIIYPIHYTNSRILTLFAQTVCYPSKGTEGYCEIYKDNGEGTDKRNECRKVRFPPSSSFCVLAC